MTLRIHKLNLTSHISNNTSFVVHFGLILDVVGGTGQQLLDTTLGRSGWVRKELHGTRWRTRILRRRRRLLLGLLEVGECAQGRDLSLLAAGLYLLGFGLEQVDGLAALLYRLTCIRERRVEGTYGRGRAWP